MKIRLFLFSSLLIFSACVQNETSEETALNETDSLSENKISSPLVEITKIPTMNKKELRIARNTIYAKYGRVFESKDLKEYFANQSWYHENPSFKEKNMKPEDKRIVRIIQLWENKTDVLFREQIDLTGNGSYENCYVLFDKNKGKFALIINDYAEEFTHYWSDAHGDKAPKEWAKIHVEEVDIHPEDGRKEIHIWQRFNDWEDPGTENIIASFDTQMRITKLGSTNYDSGGLTFNKEGTVTMQVSNCPEHTADYKLDYGKLVKFDEQIGKEPPGGCAACFSENALVDIGNGQSEAIKNIKSGSRVTTYDISTGKSYLTSVKRVLTVYHEALYQLDFGMNALEVTADHPFYVQNKGWCSLDPEATKLRYENYPEVALLEEGDVLVSPEGDSTELHAITKLPEGKMTYTIESLENGNTFVVNGVVVGTETRITNDSSF